jgi:hypothetical protein
MEHRTDYRGDAFTRPASRSALPAKNVGSRWASSSKTLTITSRVLLAACQRPSRVYPTDLGTPPLLVAGCTVCFVLFGTATGGDAVLGEACPRRKAATATV